MIFMLHIIDIKALIHTKDLGTAGPIADMDVAVWINFIEIEGLPNLMSLSQPITNQTRQCTHVGNSD